MAWVSDLFRTQTGGRRAACRESCQKYGSLGEGYVETCRKMCDADSIDTAKISIEDFACRIGGTPQTAYASRGYICPGFTPEVDSAQGRAYTQQATDAIKLQELANAGQTDYTKYILIFAALLILGMVVYYFFF